MYSRSRERGHRAPDQLAPPAGWTARTPSRRPCRGIDRAARRAGGSAQAAGRTTEAPSAGTGPLPHRTDPEPRRAWSMRRDGGDAGNRTPVHCCNPAPSTGVARKGVLLGPDSCSWHLSRRAQPQCESHTALRHDRAAISLSVAGCRIESITGPTDLLVLTLRQRERSQCAWNWHLCCAGSVYEIALHPRPASRSFAGNVETDHPHARPCT